MAPPRRAAALAAGLLAASSVLQGCTSIVIRDPDKVVSVERSFGFAHVSLSPSAKGVAAEIRSLGVVIGPTGVTAGYASQKLVALGDDCRLVLWVRNPDDVARLEALVGSLDRVCLLENEREDEE